MNNIICDLCNCEKNARIYVSPGSYSQGYFFVDDTDKPLLTVVASKAIRYNIDINYCPMCGRDLREERY